MNSFNWKIEVKLKWDKGQTGHKMCATLQRIE